MKKGIKKILQPEVKVETILKSLQSFAHGFQTLMDDTEVFYQMSEFYAPVYARGVRWDDPAFGIEWPIHCPILSGKDRSYKGFGS